MSIILIFAVAKKTAEEPRQPGVVSLINNDADREAHVLLQSWYLFDLLNLFVYTFIHYIKYELL